MRRLFQVWNWAYRPIFVIGTEVEEVMAIALKIGHIRRARAYRKFKDCTDEEMSNGLLLALNTGISGVATREGDRWLIDDKPTWETDAS